MNLSKSGLLFVVFVDVMGQGIIFPIFNTLVMDPSQDFLAAGTSDSTRHFDYGLVMSVFFVSWFLGSVYISKLSDSIGRKNGILICLTGTLAGYMLTIVSLAYSSLWLMALGRAITGFTAGNQPIAQAAMVDLSRNDAERTRNMGLILSALSVGLVAGPIIGGVFSDKSIIGGIASYSLPFYVAMGLVLTAMALIAFFFEDKLESRAPLQISPLDIFRLLWKVVEMPNVARISIVFFFYMFALNTFYIFMDNYLTSRFDMETLGTSLAMLILGAVLAISSAVLVPVFSARFSKQAIVIGTAIVLAASSVLFASTGSLIITYLAIVPLAIAFAIGYPTLLSIFSASVDATEQGWVMGVSVALFTSGAGITSFVGGELMGVDIHYPFYIALASAALAIALLAVLWRVPGIQQIVGMQSSPAE